MFRYRIYGKLVQCQSALHPTVMQDLAKFAGAGGRHLSRLFHSHVGMSVLEYGNMLRVAHAQMLLRETRLDVERVAEQAGFSSTRQLHRAWRKLHGTPPRAGRLHARQVVDHG